MFDFPVFIEASVDGIPLVLFVLALTTWLADAIGAQGKQKMVISMLVGLVFGVGYQIGLTWPVTFAAWFAVIVYGLSLGLLASGTWDTARLLVEKLRSPAQG